MEYKPSFVDQLDIDYIAHHGIKGQKWGVRRFQNPDGTLTPEGRKRYAVRESKGTFLDKNRTWMDADLKKANEMGGNINRAAVHNKVDAAYKASKEVRAAEKSARNSTREAYSAYAELYNKHVAKQGISDRLDPKTFNWYTQQNYIDRDVDEAVWDDRSRDSDRLFSAMDKHEDDIDKLYDARKNVADNFIKQYNDAVLKDIPNDRSNQAVNRILKKYGADRVSLGYSDYYDDRDYNDPDYGWNIYNLFDA